MSLGTNTITITLGTETKVLNRINQDHYSSQYYLREKLQEFTVNVRHSQEAIQQDGTRFDRHNVEIIHVIFATETSPAISRTAYSVFRNKRSDDYEGVEETFSSLVGLTDPTVLADLLAWKS